MPILSQVTSRSNLDELLKIADTVVLQTGDQKDLSGIVIRSFEDQAYCVVQEKDVTWFSRLIDVIGAIFTRKKVTPYSLKDNLNYLYKLIENCSLPEGMRMQQEVVVKNSLEEFFTLFHKIIGANLPSTLGPLVQKIDDKAGVLLASLTTDINSKIPVVEEIAPVLFEPDVEDVSTFNQTLDDAIDGFSATGETLDSVIELLRSYQSDNSEQKKVVDTFRGALQKYRAIQTQGKELERISQIDITSLGQDELKELYDDSERCRKKLFQLLNAVQGNISSVGEQRAEALSKAYQGLVVNVLGKCAACEASQTKLRLALYEHKDLSHFDTLRGHISKSGSFEELSGWLNLVRSEVALLEQNKFPTTVVDAARQKVEACIYTLVETSIDVSVQKREALNASLLAMKAKAPTEIELKDAWLALKQYEGALPHLQEWLNTSLSSEVKTDLQNEIKKGTLVITQANTIIDGQFQALKARAQEDLNHLAGTQYTVNAPVHADAGGVAVGMMHGGTVTVTNYYNSATQDFMQKMTGPVRSAVQLGLMNFSDIASVIGFSQAFSPGLYTACKMALANIPAQVWASVPYVLYNVVNLGYSYKQAAVIIGVGLVGVPLVMQRYAPKGLQRFTPMLQMLYLSYGPGLITKGHQQYINLTAQESPPVAIPTVVQQPQAAPPATKPIAQVLPQPYSPKQTPGQMLQAADDLRANQPIPPQASPVSDGRPSWVTNVATKISELWGRINEASRRQRAEDAARGATVSSYYQSPTEASTPQPAINSQPAMPNTQTPMQNTPNGRRT